MTQSTEAVDTMKGILSEEQMARLTAMTSVAEILRKQTKLPAKATFAAGGLVTELDVMDLHRMTQYVIDGRDPWEEPHLELPTYTLGPEGGPHWTLGPPQPAFPREEGLGEDGYPDADVAGVPFARRGDPDAITILDPDPETGYVPQVELASANHVHTHNLSDGRETCIKRKAGPRCEIAKVDFPPHDADGPE